MSQKVSRHHWSLKKVECTTIMTTRWLESRMSLSRDKYETLQAIVQDKDYRLITLG